MSYRNTKYHATILATSILAFMAQDKDSAGGSSAPEAPSIALDSFIAAHPIEEVVNIELKKIVIDAGTQPRVAIDPEVVKEYGDIVKSAAKDGQPNPFDSLPDDKLPQVFRDETGRCVLAEGFHRFGGHKVAHAKEMKVAIRKGSERDALLFSLSTNQEHGVRRTNKDKQRAVKTALKDPEWAQYGNAEIARFCGVSEFMVRDNRSAVGTPTVRTVTVRGKRTKMDTSAIGKGKGGGKKGKKAAAKKSGKSKTTKTSGVTVTDETKGMGEMHREITKIKNIIGGKQGDEFFEAMEKGTLDLSKRDIREWAALKDSTIRNVAPLVLGGARMKPYKAYEFVAGGIPEKVQELLHNLAIGSGGTYSFKGDGFTVTVEHKGK